MKVLTAAQMREVDRKTIELGIPGLILMENAGNRVVEFLADEFAPLDSHRIVVLCGKGNNGGDGWIVGGIVAGRSADECDSEGRWKYVQGHVFRNMDDAWAAER